MASERLLTSCLPALLPSPTVPERWRTAAAVSCGVAGTSECGYGTQEILRVADMALYRAKDTGRNRVCRAGPADVTDRLA
ncbi:MAG: hypothetical protein ACR2OL_03175 [Anderseniella sp.]